MKITIDTTNKTIEVEGLVNFEEMVKEVKRLLPDVWKEYSFQSKTSYSYYIAPLQPIGIPAISPDWTYPTVIC